MTTSQKLKRAEFMRSKRLSALVKMACDDFESAVVAAEDPLEIDMSTWLIPRSKHEDDGGGFEPCSVCVAGSVLLERGFVQGDKELSHFDNEGGEGEVVSMDPGGRCWGEFEYFSASHQQLQLWNRLRAINQFRIGNVDGALRELVENGAGAPALGLPELYSKAFSPLHFDERIRVEEEAVNKYEDEAADGALYKHQLCTVSECEAELGFNNPLKSNDFEWYGPDGPKNALAIYRKVADKLAAVGF